MACQEVFAFLFVWKAIKEIGMYKAIGHLLYTSHSSPRKLYLTK